MTGRRGAVAPTALLVALTLVSCSAPPPPAAPVEFANTVPGVEYVGRDGCRSCHLGKSATYARSGMGRAFYPLTPDRVVEEFADDSLLVLDNGLHYRMSERDGRYYQRQYLLDSAGNEMAVDEHELLWVVGSNQHNRSYLIEIDEKLFQAPVCWYPLESRWALCPGFEGKNDHFYREVSDSCLFCHNGVMTRVAEERNRFDKPYPHGIGCERCHGPGALHVERWSSGRDEATGELDATIMNPRRLDSPAARNQVCYQCHFGDAASSERVNVHGSDLRDYRPGEPLEDSLVVFRYDQPTRHQFGLSAQGDRMVLSACYEASGERLECLTCHDPHVSVYDEDRPPDLFRSRCLGCHAVEDCSAPDDERQSTAETADNCITCHMRRAEPDDLRFSVFTDHWIRRRIDDDEVDHRERFVPRPAFPQELERMDPGRAAYHRGRAAFLKGAEAPPSQRASLFTRAEAEFLDAIESGFAPADAWFFLGKSRLGLGRLDEARVAFGKAVELEPAHHDGNYALGQTLDALGKRARAQAVFDAMLERDPDDPMALAEAARTRFAEGDVAAAIERLAHAVEVAAWDAKLRVNYGMALAGAGRMAEAAEQGRIAVRLNPDGVDAWTLYANAAAEAGLTGQAEQARRWLDAFRRRPQSAGAVGMMP